MSAELFLFWTLQQCKGSLEILVLCAVTRGPSNGYGKLPPPTNVLPLIHYYSVLLFLYYLVVLSIHQCCGANGNLTLCPCAHKKPQTMQLLHQALTPLAVPAV